MTKQGWFEEMLLSFIEEFHEIPDNTPHHNEVMARYAGYFEKKSSQELSTFAEEVEKEVIGKNEVPKIKADYPELGKLTINTEDFHRRIERNGLRAKQRQAFTNLKTKRGIK